MRPLGDDKEKTVKWITGGAMQSASYEQLQAAYSNVFERFNLRLNKTQLKAALMESVKDLEKWLKEQ